MSDMVAKFAEHLRNMTAEQKREMVEFFTDNIPKGWVSIEEHLPMMYGKDIMQGYSMFKVRDKYGNEFESMVSDGNIWYYFALENNITHWFND